MQSVERVLDYLNTNCRAYKLSRWLSSRSRHRLRASDVDPDEIGIDCSAKHRNNSTPWHQADDGTPSIRNLQGVAAVPGSGGE